MDFSDTPEQAAFRSEARAWIKAHYPRDWRGENIYSDPEVFLPLAKAWQQKKVSDGWACITWPTAVGGRGGSAIESAIFEQEEDELFALNVPFIIGHGMAGPTLIACATPEQQQRFLPPMISGEDIWCQLFSEPAAGSDLAGIRTSAVRDGDHWVVNGQKIWTTFAHHADWAILVTRSDPGVAKHKGLTYFVLDMKSPGVEVRPIKQATGEAEFNEVFLTDVRIPDANRIGAVGDGWRVAMATLMSERVAVGAGIDSNFTEVYELAANIQLENGPALEDSGVQQTLADWYVRSTGVKNFGLRMMSDLSKGKSPGPEASLVKLVLSSGRQNILSYALDLMEQGGVLDKRAEGDDAPDMQQSFFRTIGNRLEGGTDEIMRNIIGERVLGLPPDVRVDKSQPFNQLPVGV